MVPAGSMDDKDLLLLLANDDHVAFTMLYEKYWATLFNISFKSLKDKDQSKDIVHDVLLDLWQRRSQAPGIANLGAYLRTAVKFKVINLVQRQRTSHFFDIFDNLVSSRYIAENKMLQDNLLDVVEAWIRVLPEKRRAIFISYFFKDLSTREIALEMNISQKTVQNQLALAIKLLRTRLGNFTLLMLLLMD